MSVAAMINTADHDELDGRATRYGKAGKNAETRTCTSVKRVYRDVEKLQTLIAR